LSDDTNLLFLCFLLAVDMHAVLEKLLRLLDAAHHGGQHVLHDLHVLRLYNRANMPVVLELLLRRFDRVGVLLGRRFLAAEKLLPPQHPRVDFDLLVSELLPEENCLQHIDEVGEVKALLIIDHLDMTLNVAEVEVLFAEFLKHTHHLLLLLVLFALVVFRPKPVLRTAVVFSVLGRFLPRILDFLQLI